jgi:sporulation protein YlmC with PRC-barrel domain
MQKKQNEGSMYIGELLNCKIVDNQGRSIGHVADIQLTKGPEYRIYAFLYGEKGRLYRLHVLNPFEERRGVPAQPKKVLWEEVEQIKPGIIILKPNSPKD